uniref:NAD-dependent epimerase/dehydratase domain-containing protein n=1 Tax=viral metagenome TaxID=1070528 RepID=A0A6C0F7P8_9ZZZZ
MKILITGINGFIAKTLANRLKGEHTIIGTTKDDSNNISDILHNIQPDYIYHVGAEIYDNDKMFESNILQTYNILEYCRAANNLKKLIIIGSSSEYGKKNKPMSENDVLEPRTIYEGTKAACSMLAQSYSNTYNIPTIIIRPFTVYGIGEKPNKFLNILFRKLINGERTVSISYGFHDYVYIDDFIDALLIISKNNRTTFDIINIGTGIQTSNHDLVKCFETVTGHMFDEYLHIESKKYDSDMWVCDTTKLQDYYTIKYSLEDGIKQMYNKYKADIP